MIASRLIAFVLLSGALLVPKAYAIGDSGGCGNWLQSPLGKSVTSGTAADVERELLATVARQERERGRLRELFSTESDRQRWRQQELQNLIAGVHEKGSACRPGPLLPEALRAGNAEVVRYLLGSPAGVRSQVAPDILFTCKHAYGAETEALRQRRRQAFEWLLQSGQVDVNASKNGQSILENCKEPELVSLFIEHGASLLSESSGRSGDAYSLLDMAILDAVNYQADSTTADTLHGLERARIFARYGARSIEGRVVEQRIRYTCGLVIKDKPWNPEVCTALAQFIHASPGVFSGTPEEPPSKRTPTAANAKGQAIPFELPAGQEAAQSASCSFADLALPADFSVFAVGGYSGRKAGFQIDQSGHEATRMDVAVNSTNKPVVLMLGAYEPTIWRVGWSPGTKIAAVLVSGYHRQAIAGLPKQTPVINVSYANRGACGYFYVANVQLGGLNPISQRLFGRAVDMVYTADKGYAVVGDSLAPKITLQMSSDTSPDSFRDVKAPLAGQLGLDDALERGLLRRANEADAAAWVEAVMGSRISRDMPPVAGQRVSKPNAPRVRNAYVVLRPFTYPPGLYGAHSATFFIPRGYPKPEGNAGHSTVYDFNSLTECMAPMCQ